MTDHWRIVYDSYPTMGNGTEWGYKLQRKRRFLWWTYWEWYGTSGNIKDLEARRDRVLEKEARKFKIVKEWA